MKAIHALYRLRESKRWLWRSCGLLVLLTLTTAAASTFANPIAEAARDMESGQLQFLYAAREGVQSNGRSVAIDFGSVTTWRNNTSRRDWCNVCDIQVNLTYRHGEVRKLRWRIADQSQRQRDDLRDLGTVDATVARDFLLGIIDHSDDRVAEEALEAAVLSEATVPWQQLLALAKDHNRSGSLRSTALFWLGQEAQDVVTAELEGVVSDDLEDLKVRKAAVFALSQRPESESIASLKRIALQHRNLELRRDALFWLAQNDAPEVIDFFEEILLGAKQR